MTRKQLENARRLYSRLEALGFDGDEVDALIRIERTLTRWAERECNGEIERDERTGKVVGRNVNARYLDPHDPRQFYIVPDRERGALRRLHTIMARHPGVIYYRQNDPRGCGLYLIDNRDGQTIPTTDPDRWIDSHYTQGIAVCY